MTLDIISVLVQWNPINKNSPPEKRCLTSLFRSLEGNRNGKMRALKRPTATENACAKCTVVGILQVVGLKKDAVTDHTGGSVEVDENESFLDELMPEPTAENGTIVHSHNTNNNGSIPSSSSRHQLESSTSTNGNNNADSENNRIATTLEQILGANGIECCMYLPCRSEKKPLPRNTYVKSKIGDSKIDCEVLVDRKLKKFKFTVFDIQEIRLGKGLANLIPTEVSNEACVCLEIDGKGELNLVMTSPELRDEFARGLQVLIKRRCGRDVPIAS